MTKNIPPSEVAARSPNPPSKQGQAERASLGDSGNCVDKRASLGDLVRRIDRYHAWSTFCFCLAILAIIAGVVVAVLEVT